MSTFFTEWKANDKLMEEAGAQSGQTNPNPDKPEIRIPRNRGTKSEIVLRTPIVPMSPRFRNNTQPGQAVSGLKRQKIFVTFERNFTG
jgi:hypothetical protein